MNSRSSFHGDSLFDQTNRLATDRLDNHQFPTFGHKMPDSHQGVILHSGGKLPVMHQADSLNRQQRHLQVQMNLMIRKTLNQDKTDRKLYEMQRSLLPVMDATKPKSTKSMLFHIKQKPGYVNHDYFIHHDGSIKRRANGRQVDRFGVELIKGEPGYSTKSKNYWIVAVLTVNKYGLVEIPARDPLMCYDRYGGIQKGGHQVGTAGKKKIDEEVGEGDHYLRPEAAAALFGVLKELSRRGLDLHLGDMSTHNGSDPGTIGKGGIHHSGHGHMGKRSGLDIDARYLDNLNSSFQGEMNSSNFSVANNEFLYEQLYKYGFSWANTYQGPMNGLRHVRMPDGTYKGVKTMVSHDDHGHFGLPDRNYNIIPDNHEVILRSH